MARSRMRMLGGRILLADPVRRHAPRLINRERRRHQQDKQSGTRVTNQLKPQLLG